MVHSEEFIYSGQGSIQICIPKLVWNGSILVTGLAMVSEVLLAHLRVFTGHVQIHTSGRVRFIRYCDIVLETIQTALMKTLKT